jgi:hypothetical protein
MDNELNPMNKPLMQEGSKTWSNGGGAPLCKQAGHEKRRRMETVLYRSDLFSS